LSEINKRHLKIPQTITLGDPSFHIPGKIDVLLGNFIFWELLCVGQIKLGKNQPVAQKTKLGWIIAGSMESENQVKLSTVSACVWHQVNTIEHQLERFWHIEEGAPCRELSENNKICEVKFLHS